VLCGGNIDPLLLAAIIDRGMVRAGRLARIQASMPATHPACWHASRPWWPTPAPTSTRCTTSAPFPRLSAQSVEVELVLQTRNPAHVQELGGAPDGGGL
jgi:threonine dehydratase